MQNHLLFNLKKRSISEFQYDRNKNTLKGVCFTMEGRNLNHKSLVRDVSLFIDESVNWNEHVKVRVGKAAKSFFQLRKRRRRRRKKKNVFQKQIAHPFSLRNINILSDKNAVYEREIVLIRVQVWLPQLVVFFLVNRTSLWLFLAVFRGGYDSPFGQGSVCIVIHRRLNDVFYRSVLVDDPKTKCFRLNSVNLSEVLIRCSTPK